LQSCVVTLLESVAIETWLTKMTIDYLSALNIGSGLNTKEIVDALVEAERAPKAGEITTAKEKRNVEISSLGQIKQGFEKLETSLSPIEKVTGLVTSASGTSVSVEISDARIAQSFNHSVEVNTVASGQTLVFGGYSSETASTGTGDLTFSFGTWNSGSWPRVRMIVLLSLRTRLGWAGLPYWLAE